MIKKYPGFKVYMLILETGIVGTTGHEILVLPEDHSQEDLDDNCEQAALNNAEMYGIYKRVDYPDDAEEDEDSWHSDTYSDDIEGYAEEYDPDKHDGYEVGAESFEDRIQDEIKRYGTYKAYTL